MKQETNKEIDLLLRRLSRRDDGAARDAETDGRHLDADELSSYAQNALPATARARYTEHLADCSRCRRLATELSLALGVTTAAAPVETVPAVSGWKKFLASLFSPMVLRYAVPALGVIVVMVVGFVAMRQRPNEASVAQLAGGSPTPPSVDGYLSGTPAPYADQRDDREGRAASPNFQKETIASEQPAKKSRESEAPAEAADSAGAVAAPAPVPTPSQVHGFSPGTVQSAPVQPVAPRKADVSVEGDMAKKPPAKQEVQPLARSAERQEAKDKAASDKAQANEPASANMRPAGRVSVERVEQNKAQSEAGGVAPAGAGARTTTRRRGADESRDEAETRSVAGRKFRKEGGIWTDTAYDSSTRTINMARGSEQFRGLVADEPAIGTIAEQLDGEVIVVWKGRAYRIR